MNGLSRLITPDPNNALFVTVAAIIIDSQFSDLLWPQNKDNLRKAMYIAVKGDGYRVGGVDGDNLRPVYSNVSICTISSNAIC